MGTLSRLSAFRANSLLAPTLIIFLSANIANVGNLAFNMLFARIMTPAQFADLTLLLTIKLGLLSLFSAIQYGISEITARRGANSARSIAASFARKSFRFTVPLCFALLFMAEFIGQTLNFVHIKALILLILAIPLFLPLVIFRGLAQGHLDLPKMVGSLQMEWIVRLGGCWLIWQAGFGLSGITIALILSILAGLIFTVDRKDQQAFFRTDTLPVDTAVLKTALPYVVIFLAQILALDGDIFIAKAMLGQDAAGAAAGMLLIQRVFFFAFLSFASVLQPIVAGSDVTDAQSRKALSRLLLAMLCISLLALSAIALKPQLFVTLFLGSQYTELAPLVVFAGIVGVSFMAAQLTTIFLIARGDHRAPFYLLGLVAVQYIAIALYMKFSSEFTYSEFLLAKTAILSVGALIFTGCALRSKPKELQECK